MNHLFTYGTLMFEEIWSLVVCGSYRSRAGTLMGFTRKAVRGAEYPVIYPGSHDDPVQGTIYLNVTPADIQRLDIFEGAYYARQHYPVILDDKEIIEAEVYVLREEYRHIASENDWDPDRFQERGLETFRNSYEGFGNANNHR